jgi:phage terminase large subunit
MVDYADWQVDEVERPTDVPISLRGCANDLAYRLLNWNEGSKVISVMVEGPRGTGKSFAVLSILYALCYAFPGIQILVSRNKRESMSTSTLKTLEKCMPAGEPALNGPKPEGRSVYRFENGSEIHLAGLDQQDRIRGGTFDIVYHEEGTESDTPDGYETMLGTLRSFRAPFQMFITTTNPKQPGHWLNRFANEGRFERLKSRFEDNPALYSETRKAWTREGEAFIQGLKALTGHRYRRDYLGEWCAAEGVVFDEYDDSVHIIDGLIEKEPLMGHTLVVPKWGRRIPIDWYGVGMDFGYRAPGVVQVWGVNDEHRMLFRVAEVYKTNWQIDQWARAIRSLREEFPFETGVADCADAGNIAFLNDRCREFMGRGEGPFLHPANKAKGKLYGFDQLRWGFAKTEGGPRTFLLSNALRYGKDPNLASANKATCFEEELPNCVWRDAVGPKGIIKEEIDPSCADHAVDAAVYFHIFAWGRSETVTHDRTIFKPGTMGHWLGDYETLGWDWRMN